MEPEKQISERESLQLITAMINKAKNSYYDTGITSMMWGAVIAVCSLVMFAQIEFGFTLPFNIYLLTFVAIIPQILITIREKKNSKIRSYDDTTMDYVWLGFGICILLLMHANIGIRSGLSGLLTEYETIKGVQPTFRYYEYISSLFLILYGLPTFITAGVFRFRPMFAGAIFCWISSVIAIYTEIRVDLLLTAAAALLAWFVPGIIMQKQCKKAKKDLELQNV